MSTIEGQELNLLAQKKKVPVSIYLASRKDREGDIIGYFVGIFDITGFKKLQQTLEEKVKERTKELQERVEELERFHRLVVGRELRMIDRAKKRNWGIKRSK